MASGHTPPAAKSGANRARGPLSLFLSSSAPFSCFSVSSPSSLSIQPCRLRHRGPRRLPPPLFPLLLLSFIAAATTRARSFASTNRAFRRRPLSSRRGRFQRCALASAASRQPSFSACVCPTPDSQENETPAVSFGVACIGTGRSVDTRHIHRLFVLLLLDCFYFYYFFLLFWVCSLSSPVSIVLILVRAIWPSVHDGDPARLAEAVASAVGILRLVLILGGGRGSEH